MSIEGTSGSGNRGPVQGGPRPEGAEGPVKGEGVQGPTAAEVQKAAEKTGITRTEGDGKKIEDATLIATEKPALEERDFTAKALESGAPKLTKTVTAEEARTNLGLTPAEEKEFIADITKAVQSVPEKTWQESPEKAMAMMTVALFEVFMKQSKGLMEFSKLMASEEFSEMEEVRTQEKEAQKFTGKGEEASKAKKIFGWVGAVVGVIAGAVAVGFATVGTAGTGTPAATAAYMALTGALIGMAKKVSDESGLTEKIAEKVAGPIIQNLGEIFGADMTEEKAQQIAMVAIGITVTVIQIGFSMGSIAATGGANVAQDAAAALDKVDDMVAAANVADDMREGVQMTTTAQNQLQNAIQTAKNAENTTEALSNLRSAIDTLVDAGEMTRGFADEVLEASQTAVSQVSKLMTTAETADSVDDVGRNGIQMTTEAKASLENVLKGAKDVESTKKALESFRTAVHDLAKAGEIADDFADELVNSSQTMDNLIATIRNVWQGSAQAAQIGTGLGDAATTTVGAVMKKKAAAVEVIITFIEKNIEEFKAISSRYTEKAQAISENAVELAKTASTSGRGALTTQAAVARNIGV